MQLAISNTQPHYSTMFLILLLLLLQPSYSISSFDYKGCVTDCLDDSCPSDPLQNSHLEPLLQFFGWNCLDDCKYKCQINETLQPDTKIHKYKGKWPFIRVLGMQEFLSVVFSLGNLGVHLYSLVYIVIFQISAKYRMRPLYIFYSLSSINAWIWSSVFHSRDKEWTEKADYFSAIFVIQLTLLILLTRMLYLYQRPWKYLLPASLISLGYFIFHWIYCSRNPARFDYEYNVLANAVLLVITNVTMFAWCICNRERSYVKWAFFSLISMIPALIMASMDFPGLWLLMDSHALWHLGTIPVYMLFYRFVLKDAEYESLMETYGRTIVTRMKEKFHLTLLFATPLEIMDMGVINDDWDEEFEPRRVSLYLQVITCQLKVMRSKCRAVVLQNPTLSNTDFIQKLHESIAFGMTSWCCNDETNCNPKLAAATRYHLEKRGFSYLQAPPRVIWDRIMTEFEDARNSLESLDELRVNLKQDRSSLNKLWK